MKRRLIAPILMAIVGFVPVSLPSRADDMTASGDSGDLQGLSPERLDLLDKWGCFTPSFKASIHQLVETKQAVADMKAEEKTLTDALPHLQKQVADAEARTAQLRQQADGYDHAADTDFATLQAVMKDPNAKLQDQLVEAQSYVWAYPSSPHQSEAQQDLQQVQKKIANQVQAQKDAEAARLAARAKLVQRAMAHDLSLDEWRGFLRDMSQDDLLKYIGRPQGQGADYWVYSGDMTTDAVTQQKVGLQVNFNAGRVISVGEAPH